MEEKDAKGGPLRRKPLREQAVLQGVAPVLERVLRGYGFTGARARAGGFRPWFPALDGGGMLGASGGGPCGGAGAFDGSGFGHSLLG